MRKRTKALIAGAGVVVFTIIAFNKPEPERSHPEKVTYDDHYYVVFHQKYDESIRVAVIHDPECYCTYSSRRKGLFQ